MTEAELKARIDCLVSSIEREKPETGVPIALSLVAEALLDLKRIATSLERIAYQGGSHGRSS